MENIDLELWEKIYQLDRKYDNMTFNNIECFNYLTKELQVLSQCKNHWVSRTTKYTDYNENWLAIEAPNKARHCKVESIDYYHIYMCDNWFHGIVNLRAHEQGV